MMEHWVSDALSEMTLIISIKVIFGRSANSMESFPELFSCSKQFCSSTQLFSLVTGSSLIFTAFTKIRRIFLTNKAGHLRPKMQCSMELLLTPLLTLQPLSALHIKALLFLMLCSKTSLQFLKRTVLFALRIPMVELLIARPQKFAVKLNKTCLLCTSSL